MSVQLVQLNGPIVQGTSEASGDAVFQRDSNGDGSVRRLTITQYLIGAGYFGAYARKTTTYQTLVTDHQLVADNSSGAFTVTLPPAATSTGQRLTIKRVDGTPATNVTYYTTIDGNASETVDGNLSIYLTLTGESYTLFCDGTNWKIESHLYPDIYSSSKSSAFNVAGEANIYLYDTSGAGFAATLPAAAPFKGKRITFKSIGSGTNALTVTDDATDLVDGAGTDATLNSQWEGFTIGSNGTTWYILSHMP